MKEYQEVFAKQNKKDHDDGADVEWLKSEPKP